MHTADTSTLYTVYRGFRTQVYEPLKLNSTHSGWVSRRAREEAAKAAATSPQISEEGSSGVMYVTSRSSCVHCRCSSGGPKYPKSTCAHHGNRLMCGEGILRQLRPAA